MRYEELMRDAHNQALMASTRVHAAFDAIYCCCPPAGTLDEALGALDLSPPDKVLVISLRDWVQHVAPLEPLPISPAQAIALAERVHKHNASSRH